MTDHTSLIARLESAGEGSRELDEAVIRTLTDAQVVARFGDFEWRPEGVGIWRAMPSPTTSVDAALALAERVLPKVWWEMTAAHGERAAGKTPALALVAAILRASEQSK